MLRRGHALATDPDYECSSLRVLPQLLRSDSAKILRAELPVHKNRTLQGRAVTAPTP
jgi:hypothetical protein